MSAPIAYIGPWLETYWAELYFRHLQNELAWVNVAGPRLEYYVHDLGKPYTYGRGAGQRTYQPQHKDAVIARLRALAEEHCNCKFEAIFLNHYRDGSDHLGWHSDDSPEMDQSRPIAIVTLGEGRDIQFRKKPESWDSGVPAGRLSASFSSAETHFLKGGSLCIMAAGMQQGWQHRIPKAGRVCGPRISLTFRGATP